MPRLVHGFPRARRRMLWIILSCVLLQKSQRMVQERARTGQFDTPNAIAKFVVMAQQNLRFKVPGLYDDVLKS